MANDTIILILVNIVFMLCGFYFFFKIKICKNNENIDNYPFVSIIIPARNEEKNIKLLLDSINNYGNIKFEVIVVNDGSIDRTKEIAVNLGATVLDSKPLPENWKGKTWACWQGAEFAKGEIFIFLDADTIIEPNGIKKLIDSFLEVQSKYPKGIVLSIAPFHKVKRFYEEFSAIFNVIMVGSMNAFTPFKKNVPTGLFGQTLIISKENYFQSDGHRSVKDKILENFFFANILKSNGIALKCLGGKGAVSFRMYPDGMKSLIDGWTKAFAKGAGQTKFSTLFIIILWISSGFIISILFLLSLINNELIGLWSAFYVAFALQMYNMLRQIGNFKITTSLFYPIYLIFYVIVFSRSLYYLISNKSINWKSREVTN